MSDTPARQLRSLVKGHDVHGNRIEVATFILAGGLLDYEVDGRPATAAQAEEAMAWIDGPWTEERFGEHRRIDPGPTLPDSPPPAGQ